MAQQFLNLATPIEIIPADHVNTKYIEFAPAYYGSGIVFVHAGDAERNQMTDRRTGLGFFELLYAELDPSGLPGRPRSFSPNIRTRFHEGPAAFTKDLKQIYFTRSNMANGQQVTGSGDQTTMKIYLADKGPEDWENVRQLPFCSDDYSVMSPALSPDNMQIIFMSDMPGGMGGWDLYISDKYSGTWSEPVNLGPTINTAGNEALPFWHARGVLFFSSDGHPGQGGLDIFAVRRYPDGTYSSPLNLGLKFNTRKDDLTFICDPEGLTGFFASSRKESLGKDDLYFFRARESLFSLLPAEPSGMDEGAIVVRDRRTLAPVTNAEVWIFDAQAGEETKLKYFDERVDTVTGESKLSLKSRVDAADSGPRYLTDSSGRVTFPIALEASYLAVIEAPEYRQKERLLDAGLLTSAGSYVVDLDRLIEAPDGSLTDEGACIQTGAIVIANASYKPLSEVVIEVRNTCSGNIQVLETDDSGRFRVCLQPGCDYAFRLNKTGFVEERYTSNPGLQTEEKVIYLYEANLADRTDKAPAAGDVLVLNHLYYDFNKSAIRTGDAQELISLAEMMVRHPTMTIELESHTDSRGDADYNMELSQRRGEAALDFLVGRGVAADRITLKPMGETNLRNHCSDEVPCSEEEHQLNRRTEIHILTLDPDVEIKMQEQR